MARRPSNPNAKRRVDLAVQLAAMRTVWPEFHSQISNRKLICRGQLRPTPVNGSYRVRIEYGRHGSPTAFVEAPQLRPRSPDGRIPHVYPGPRPCLYLPGSGEWTPNKRIADTVVPWLALWLFYYELWHATGEWLGGGAQPGGNGKVEPPEE
jgi:hypothetical protein